MTKYPGLQFKKFDLHVHTPASHDFDDKGATPEDVVKEALDKDLKGIAVVDHHTGENIDAIKEAANQTPLVIFPGVEICCAGGERGIHVIALLDVDKETKHISALLAALGISSDDFGKKDTATTKAPFEVIEIISSPPFNGIAVLAHSTSSKGVLSEIKGVTRTQIFEHPGLLAVESSQSDFTDEDKKAKGKRAIDVLNGKDENYAYRRLGVFISSDSRRPGDSGGHTIKGVGSEWTYLKVDDSPNLESLRQCFIDRDVRIRQLFEYQEVSFPKIVKIEINGGFFDGESVSFHEGLNSVLGAKGAGKSLLVELVRFALDKPPSPKSILSDHQRKLENRLETYGTVSLTLIDETGAEHTIERTYDPSENSPFGEDYQENVANSFNALFLSQNEIVQIAESEAEQIAFIDRFFDFQHFKEKIRSLEQELGDMDRQFSEGLRAVHLRAEAIAQLKKTKIELEKVNKLFSDPIYDKYKKLEDKDRILKAQSDFLLSVKEELEQDLEQIGKLTSPVVDANFAKDPAIKRNSVLISSTITSLKADILKLVENVDDSVKAARLEYSKWKPSFDSEKEVYQKHVREAGGDRKTHERQRLRVLKESSDLEEKINKLATKAESLKITSKKRNAKMDELYEVYKEYSHERKEKCEKFERESNGRLQVVLHESTNVDEFKEQLKALKKGSYLRDVEVDQICEKISPREFIYKILRYQAEPDEKKKEKRLADIATIVDVELSKIQSLCEFLLTQVDFEDLLSLQYVAHPEDRPEIKFEVNPGHYELVRDVSVGQKCTAMLIIALSDGSFPIIIDQPEDSLDVRSVWEDMCTKIRKGKDHRQFIFTTHNSCLAVASDTDKYTVVESSGNKGHVVISGALESGQVKEEVIKYLEGGRPTYIKKADKYGNNIKDPR